MNPKLDFDVNQIMKAYESYADRTISYLDSRDVAKLIGKKHNNLVRDIKLYIKQIEADTENYYEPSEYFIEQSYKTDGKSRNYLCYLVTDEGFDYIVHRLTGLKNTMIIAELVERRHKAEEEAKRKWIGVTG
ncbi:MAG: Rha family transcriptional regulator [Lachnospiraceae bacterium]|nr:Rha family transcriptional regulator [Lachnospiraceae bacterium]